MKKLARKKKKNLLVQGEKKQRRFFRSHFADEKAS